MPRLVNGLEQIFTNLGIVGAGYKLFFFDTLTVTPKTTYSNAGLSVSNPNPVVCDQAGRPEFDIWGADSSTYKLVLGTPDSVIGNINPIVTIDPIDDLNTDSIINLNPLPAAYWGTTTGTSAAYLLDALVPITSYSYKYCFFVDFHIANAAAPTLDVNDIGVINLKKYTGAGTKVALQAGDLQAQRYLVIIDGVDAVVLNPQYPFLNGNNISQSAIRIVISNDVSDATNDIDFADGTFLFSDGTGFASLSAIIKRLDANWVVGTNQGGLDTGSKANSTKYNCFAIYNPTSNISDAIFSIAASPLLPSGYTKYRLLGTIITDSSGVIRPFIQIGTSFYFKTPVLDINTTDSQGTTAILYTMTVPSRKVEIRMNCYAIDFDDSSFYLSDPDTVDLAPSRSVSPLLSINDGDAGSASLEDVGGQLLCTTNASSQIRARAFATINNFRIATLGWVDLTL